MKKKTESDLSYIKTLYISSFVCFSYCLTVFRYSKISLFLNVSFVSTLDRAAERFHLPIEPTHLLLPIDPENLVDVCPPVVQTRC